MASISDYERSPTVGRPTTALAEKLKALWETEPGFVGWLGTVDHKEIGLRYIVTAFAFLVIGGIEALIFRLQLAWSNVKLLSPEQYDQLFTMHGMTMIFLYASPILSGFSNYLWPLLLGSRDMALPRLNALSYWIYLCAGIFLYSSFLIGFGPNVGWFNYVPLAARAYNNGPNIDVYSLGMILLGISTTVGAINFIVTFLRLRCPGMSVNRVPILVWGTLTASAANIFAIPSVSLAFFLLWMDRNLGTHFFDTTAGGSALLWQHLFWMFGHPWVYAIVLPAMGMVSDGLPVFCRRPLVGYTAVAAATVATMILGFGVWVHHMFATGLPNISLSFFSAASIIITVPSAVGVFAWLATIWTGRPVFTTPFLFFASFILLFTIGGVSGFMTGSVPVDWQLTDTYFVVAHLHYVLIGINVFPVAGAVYFWFPKFTGKLMDERLGRWNFWTMFIGFNLGFFPMHISGLLGMPRRIYTYPDSMGWDWLNLITTVGSFLFGFGVLMLIYNVVRSLRHGPTAPANPWDAPTLEWAVSSPPPPYNFTVIPVVATRHPLWEDRLDQPEDAPRDTLVPLYLALSMTVVTAGLALVNWWVVAVGGALTACSILAWLWPEARLGETVVPATGRGRDG
jgi:cytochrome c oxidase subunit 1/cytochrome c oxidase subunit I+III